MTGKRKATYRLRSNSKKQKGFTLPGYNNLGPFNDLNTPLKKSDAAALKHDKEYAKLGKRAYWTFNQADEDFLEEIDDEKDIGAQIAKKVFRGKKKLAEWNILPQDPLSSKKENNPFLEFDLSTGDAPLTRARKKALERQNALSQRKITDTFQKQKLEKRKTHLQQIERFNPKTLKKNPQPVLNLQEKTQVPETKMVDGKGSGNKAGLEETKVDAVVDVERGFPNYQFASLPWTGVQYISEKLYTNIDLGFRMTSPYDTIVGLNVTDRNTNASGKTSDVNMKDDASDTTPANAMWFNYYAQLYKYYHVVSCKWSILFENLHNEPIWITQMYLNDETPSEYATAEDMMQWPDVEAHYVHSAAHFVGADGIQVGQLQNGWQNETNSAATGANFIDGNAIQGGKNTLQLSGQYSPGDYNHDIRLDADVENWTAISTNPKLREILFFRILPESQARRLHGDQGAVNYGRKFKLKFTVKLEYLVEFKELDKRLRWPTSQDPLLFTFKTDFAGTEKTSEVPPNP